jgi:charged multivesicular body protein 7
LPSSHTSNDLLTISTGSGLLRDLQSKQFGTPLALGSVINDALAKHEIIPLKEFLAAKSSIYNKSWAISPFTVITWTLRQLGVLGTAAANESLAVGTFVVVENVEAAASAVLKKISATHKSNIDLIMSHKDFSDQFQFLLNDKQSLSAQDLRILLRHLSRDKHALTYNDSTIKFRSPTSTTPPDPITPEDVTIANIRSLIASTELQILTLNERIATLDTQSRAAVASKNRTAALSALRSKKLVDSTLARRTAALAQLEEVFTKIEAATDNVEIIKVMKNSATTLKSLNKQVGGVEAVEDVVDALKEEMTKVDEVSGVVNEVGADAAAVDEVEVDEEFEALERAEREKHEAAEREKLEKKKAEEHAAKIKEEAEEAERTRERLEELEKLDKARKEKERQGNLEASTESQSEEQVMASTAEGVGRISLEEESAPEDLRNIEVEKDKQPILTG